MRPTVTDLLAQPDDEPTDLTALDAVWEETVGHLRPRPTAGCPQVRDMPGPGMDTFASPLTAATAPTNHGSHPTQPRAHTTTTAQHPPPEPERMTCSAPPLSISTSCCIGEVHVLCGAGTVFPRRLDRRATSVIPSPEMARRASSCAASSLIWGSILFHVGHPLTVVSFGPTSFGLFHPGLGSRQPRIPYASSSGWRLFFPDRRVGRVWRIIYIFSSPSRWSVPPCCCIGACSIRAFPA